MDRSVFIQIISENEGIINKVVSFYASKQYSPEDLYQEIVLNLWRSYPDFRGDSKVSTWIYRIALNTCITYYRKKSKTPKTIELYVEIPDIVKNDDIRELYRLISMLSKIDKALILLWLEDKSYKEIAEITGLSTTNVGTKLSRIKEQLKSMSNS